MRGSIAAVIVLLLPGSSYSQDWDGQKTIKDISCKTYEPSSCKCTERRLRIGSLTGKSYFGIQAMQACSLVYGN